MGRQLLIFLIFIVLLGCKDKSESTETAIKDSVSVSKVAAAATGSGEEEDLTVPDSLKSMVRSLNFCAIAYEGSDAMEGSATPTLQNDGSIAGLNGLLKISPAVGAAKIYGVATSKDGYVFTLKFDNGSKFSGEISTSYGSTALNLDLGKDSQSLICLDSRPEEAE